MKRLIYINGDLVREDKAVISVFDRGLNYGDGLFETVKAYGGRPAFLKEHLERLATGLQFMRIPRKPLKGFISDLRDGVIGELLKTNKLAGSEAYIKIIVTRGADSSGHALPKDLRPNVIIISKQLDVKAISLYQKNGVKASVIKGCSPAVPCFKTLNYLPNIIAKAEARWRGAFEGIFTAKDGSILEGTSSNVFIVKNGALKTPPINADFSTGILPGVTRGAVIGISKKSEISVKEMRTHVKDLYGCDEAFLTNSIIEVVPLVSVDGKRVGSGRPGPVTKRIQLAYSRAVSENLS